MKSFQVVRRSTDRPQRPPQSPHPGPSVQPARSELRPVAAKHHLQVTDDHFSKALQQPAVLPRTGSQADRTAQEKTPVLQGSASECDVVRVAGVPPQGLEP